MFCKAYGVKRTWPKTFTSLSSLLSIRERGESPSAETVRGLSLLSVKERSLPAFFWTDRGSPKEVSQKSSVARRISSVWTQRQSACTNCFKKPYSGRLFPPGTHDSDLQMMLKKILSCNACWIWDDYSQLGATRLVGYLSSHIQRALVE